MRTTIYTLLILSSAIIATSCGTDKETSVSGEFNYTLIKKGDGKEALEGDYLVLHLKGVDGNDSVWFDRSAYNNPMTILLDSTSWTDGKGGFYEIFYNARKGDSISFDLLVSEFFNEVIGIPVPPEAEGVEDLTLYFGVDQVLGPDEFYTYMTNKQAEMQNEQIGLENEEISQYLEEQSWEAQMSPAGVRVVVHEQGEGPNAMPGQRVFVAYAGYLLDGSLFDTSMEDVAKEYGIYMEGRDYAPYPFTIDQDRVIQGWHDGFKMLNKGSKATLIIPSNLGYGPQGNGRSIPGNSVLRFDVEVVDIQ